MGLSTTKMIKNDQEMFRCIRMIEKLRLEYADDQNIQATADILYADVVSYNRITSKGRIGDWVPTESGRRFWLLDPRPEDVFIEDIAGPLSRICRYNGRLKPYHYSVAQHCVVGSFEIKLKYALPFLVHDAPEAYDGDIITPIKNADGIKEGYGKIESKTEWAINTRYNIVVDEETRKAVKLMDNRMLAQEFRDLTSYRLDLGASKYEPLSEPIVPWSAELAEETYLERFYELIKLQK